MNSRGAYDVLSVRSLSLLSEQQQRHNALAGTRVAITGGTSGLGLALVRELIDRWAHVAFVARGHEGVSRVMREQAGAHGITGDVSRKDDIHPIAMQVLGALGGL